MNALVIIFICLLLMAFFSGMEIAFVSANRLRIEIDKKQGLFSARIISIFLKNPAQYIATMLVGNNLVLVVYGIIIAGLLKPVLLSYFNSEYVILIMQTIISTTIILVTAEFLPKTFFRIIPNIALNFFSIPVYIFYLFFYPVTHFLIGLSHFLLKKVYKTGIDRQKDLYVFGKVDLDHLVKETRNSDISLEATDTEIKIFKNALDFSKVKLRDCMVPRTEIVAIDQNSSVNELSQLFIETGFSKILLYNENIDNIVGYINSKELFKNPQNIMQKIIKMPIVPETMNANKLLRVLMQQKKSLALVVDEFGGTAGIITVEDIIEEVIGEIEDEHDTIEIIEKQLSENNYVFSGKIPIDSINKKYNLKLPESNEYDTLAGFILFNTGRIPELYDKIEINNFAFKIMRIKKKRIELVHFKYIDS